MKAALGDLTIHSALHEQLIHQMNEAGGTFHVLILKTKLTIPYTSVFLRLDCKYWSDAAETKDARDNEGFRLRSFQVRSLIGRRGEYKVQAKKSRLPVHVGRSHVDIEVGRRSVR